MARILVTGAGGILGAACVEALLERGDEVIALVRGRDPGSRLIAEGLLDRCVEVRGGLKEAERLISERRPEGVLHLAAQTQVPVANRDPLSTFESNVRGTWRLLEACRTVSQGPRAIVVASSDKAYGPAPLPTPESAPLSPTAPYDVSKACTDLIARSYASHFGLPVVVTRCANIYGPGDRNAERLIPGVCASLRAGERPVLRSTGGMRREWLYVEDAAAANVFLLDRAADRAGEAFNVGSGESATAAEITRRLIALSGTGLEPVVQCADPPGEIAEQGLDTGRLRAAGWRPRVGLDTGLERTWRWFA